MNGKPYDIVMAPSAYRWYKKYSKNLQDKIKEEAKNISKSPHSYKQLVSPLSNIRSYSFHYQKSEYRIAYRIVKEKHRIEIVLVKTRENFYNLLKKILLK